MPVWAWLLIGFLALLVFGAIVDYSNKRKRKGMHNTAETNVDDLKTKQQRDMNHFL